MRRPLIGSLSAALLILIISYSTTAAYNDYKNDTADISWLDCQPAADCNGSPVAVLEIAVSGTDARIDTIKASLRAGVAVGKTVMRTAGVVVGSLALAAHHGAMALTTAALGVF
jgi:hypothetical protein